MSDQSPTHDSIAIVIVNYNTAALLHECITAVQANSRMTRIEIVVVDNASVDDSLAMLNREFPDITLVALPRNVGFGAGNNHGVDATQAKYVMLLNSDAILRHDTATILAEYLETHPGVSCVGPRIELPDGRRQPRVFGRLPSLWRIAMQSLGVGTVLPAITFLGGIDGQDRGAAQQDVGWISGVCMMMRRTDFVAVGGFDPDIFMYCEDVELCWRLASLGRIVHLDQGAVMHYGGASSPSVAAQLRNALWQQQNLLAIVRKHDGPGHALAARPVLAFGLMMRMAIGLLLLPVRGLRENVLFRASWLRLRDLLAPTAPRRG
jgi:N-acetylglucosaminyl-diphospho-decaprenol L-rhamnosyltransferase